MTELRASSPPFSILILLVFIMTMKIAQADEGMWLLNDPPRQLLRKKHDFELTDEWLERAMKASVRFNNGGSGSFVSPEGLIITNQHIGAGCLQKLGTTKRNHLRDGYTAKSRSQELRCPDLELNVLQEIIDVTEKVQGAVKKSMSPAEANAARRAVISGIEKESLEKTGLRSDVVTFYQGALYHLYRYKKYTDVRLVFAPEEAIAFFGGDTDNFEYPRYCLDVCLFRAYENDKPAEVEHYFHFSETPLEEGDLVFVTGHPGTTNRLETLAKLKHRRDITLPYTLYRLRTLEAKLRQFAERGARSSDMASTSLHRVANARKAYTGMYQGLLDPSVLASKAKEERALIKKHKEKHKRDPWAAIERAEKKLADFEMLHALLERGDAFYSELFDIARHIVRLTAEREKPNGERLREYRDSNLESLKLSLFSPAPIHPELEKAKLMASLSFLAENLGGEHPMVRKILAGKAPGERATELIDQCTLLKPDAREKLVEAGAKVVTESDDPMIRLAILVDAEARKLRARYETQVEEVERQAYAEIAQTRFEVLGSNVAPDATFTLRLAFGVVKGYEVEGVKLPRHTTVAGAKEHAEDHNHREPFHLPASWREGQFSDPRTPLNFVSTADTIGGNSGSPVLNRKGEIVGINFDRNRHGLVRNFVYTDEQARHISVHGFAVRAALKEIYRVPDALSDELFSAKGR